MPSTRPSQFKEALFLIGLMLLLTINGRAATVRAEPTVIRVPLDYPSIQPAVDAAAPGDTIIVSAGTYPGNITITKSIILTRESASNVTIDARGDSPGILIANTTRVSVSGFSIRNTGFLYNGLLVFQSSRVTIEESSFQTSGQSNGTYIVNSNTVTVRNSTMTQNVYGVSIVGGYGNSVQKSNITGNSVGMALYNSNGDKLTDNIIRANGSGLQIFSSSTANVVGRNMVMENDLNGIWLQNSNGNWLTQNEVDNNNRHSYSAGIYIQNSRGNMVFHNNIRNNALQMYGVAAPGDLAGSTWNDGAAKPTGNFWSDYVGLDDGSNGRTSGDGVGDTLIPYPCPNGGRPCSYFNGTAGVDWYPLMTPFQSSTLNVTASANPQSGYVPLAAAFTGTASGGVPPYSYSWSLGDNSTSQSQNVTHTYTLAGSFVATLSVTDAAGTSSTDSVPVTVLAKYGALVIHVLDQNQKPLPANVTSLTQPLGQVKLNQRSNNLGISAWTRLVPGPYSIQALSTGYDPSVVDVTVLFNQTVNYAITLKPTTPAGNLSVPTLAGAGTIALAALGALFVLRRRRKGSAQGKAASPRA